MALAVAAFADGSARGFDSMVERGVFPAVLPPLATVAASEDATAAWFRCFFRARERVAPAAVPWDGALACAADGPARAAPWALRVLYHCARMLPHEDAVALLSFKRAVPVCRRVFERGLAQAFAEAIGVLAYAVAYEDGGRLAELFDEEFLEGLFDYILAGDNHAAREWAIGIVGKLVEAGRALGDDRLERRMEDGGFIEALQEAAEGESAQYLLEYLRR
jgi:hypothetical protein